MHEFRFTCPETIDEALRLIADCGDRAGILAGGTDLVPQMRAGAKTPGLVVDVKRIPELGALTEMADGLTIGAAVSCSAINASAAVRRDYPALADATSLVGGVQIQNRASVGGNLCNASPSGDTIPALMVLGAEARIRGAGGTRAVAVADFCTGPGANVLRKDELLESLHLPAPPADSGSAFLRFTPRNEMDIAVVNAAAFVVLSADRGRFVSARVAFGAAGPTPILAADAAARLAGRPVSGEAVTEAAQAARAAARPIDDMRGSAEQRRHLVQVLAARVLRRAVERAGGEVA